MVFAGILTAVVLLGVVFMRISGGEVINLTDPDALMNAMGAGGLGLGTALQTTGLAAISLVLAYNVPRFERLFGVNQSGLTVAERLAFKAPSIGAMAAATLGGLTVGWFPGWLLELALATWPWLGSTQTQMLVKMLQEANTGGLLLMVLAINVVAPIGEEIMFRGMLWHALEPWTGRVATWALTSAVFAAWHFDPIAFGPLFAVGALCGWVRWWSGSIWPAIAVHLANNGLATLGAIAFSPPSLDTTPLWLALLGLALSTGAALIAWAARRETP